MSTNIVIALDKRQQKADGSYPVIMRVCHQRRTTSISLGVSVKEKDWNAKEKTLKPSASHQSVTRLNNIIQKKKADALDIILKLSDAGQLHSLSVTTLKERIVNENDDQSFFTYSDKLIADLVTANRVGTARSYNDVKKVIKSYCKGKDLKFRDISFDFLSKFEAHHKSKGNSINGFAVYMRTVRAIYNKAIKEGVVDKEYYPFNDYKLKTIPTEKRALDWEFMKQIIALNLSPEHECFHARNFFLASYMMYGMNFTDMAFLRKSNIKDGRVKYRRRKTSKLYDIKITDSLQAILSFYLNSSSESQYIFPIVKRELIQLQYKDIEWARKRYNKKLKTIANLCNISENLTSYVSRHSFATQAMLQQVPLNAISSMLGHSSLKTTEIYIKSLPTNIFDEFNTRITQQ